MNYKEELLNHPLYVELSKTLTDKEKEILLKEISKLIEDFQTNIFAPLQNYKP